MCERGRGWEGGRGEGGLRADKLKVEQLYKVSNHCLDDHHFKKEELESVGKLSTSLLTNCLSSNLSEQ